MYDAIIFDLDQTLIDTSELKKYRDKRQWKICSQKMECTSLYPGVKELFNLIGERNLNVGVVTNSPKNYAKELLEFHNLNVDVIIGYHECRKKKPNAEPMIKCSRLLGVSPDRTLCIGDDRKDIQSGKNAKMDTIAVSYGVHCEDELFDENPDYMVTNFQEVNRLINVLTISELKIKKDVMDELINISMQKHCVFTIYKLGRILVANNKYKLANKYFTLAKELGYEKDSEYVKKSLINAPKVNKIINEIIRLATNNDIESQHKLAYYYYCGKYVKKDYKQAKIWCEKAARNGHAYSQYMIGFMNLYGQGGEVNYKEAKRWLTIGDQSGEYNATCELGNIYYYSLGVNRDERLAYEYYEKAASAGSKIAKYKLGEMYLKGIVVPTDIPSSLSYFEDAIKAGYTPQDNYYESAKKINKNEKQLMAYFKNENDIIYMDEYYPRNRFSKASLLKSDYLFREGLITLKYEKDTSGNNYQQVTNYFKQQLSLVFKLLDVVVCIIPSSNKDNEYSRLRLLIQEVCKMSAIEDTTECLKRKKTVESSALGGARNLDKHLNSIDVINKDKLVGKHVLLVDDIYTTGSTMSACEQLLYDSGALYVSKFVLGRTVSY